MATSANAKVAFRRRRAMTFVMMRCVAYLGAVGLGLLAGAPETAAQRSDAAPPLPGGHMLRPAQPVLGQEQATAWMPLEAVTLPSFAQRRAFMLARIRSEIARRGSTLDMAALDRVLAAMHRMEREKFVPPSQGRGAYLPASLDIGYGQTISDAYFAALMTTVARVPADGNVLDIGTGSGYQAALLGLLARRVTSIEIVPQLARQARKRLRQLGYGNVAVLQGDGFAGSPRHAPFDAIIVAAGAPAPPKPLLDQLKPGGRLVIPIGATALEEQLLVFTKAADGSVSHCSLGAATAVPLTGKGIAALRSGGGSDRLPAAALCYGRPVT